MSHLSNQRIAPFRADLPRFIALDDLANLLIA